MASLRRQQNSPYWIACFTLPDGRRTNRSTRTTDKRQALRIALQYEEATIQSKTQRLSEKIVRKVISDIFEMSNHSKLESSTVESFAIKWLKRKSGEVTDNTHEKYRSVVMDFLRFMGPNCKRDLLHLEKDTIVSYRQHTASRLTNRSANNAIKILRTMLGDAIKDGLMDRNLASAVPLLKVESKQQRRPFTDKEISTILKHCNREWRGMVLFGLYTGQRIGDLASLTWDCVDLAQREIRFRTTKTGRFQVLPIFSDLFDYLTTNAPSRAGGATPIFPELFEIQQRNAHSGTLSNQFRKILANAGLVEHRPHVKTGNGRATKRRISQVSFHSLRHTATSFLKRAGVSDAIVRDLIGHESVAVSAQYTHMDMETKRSAIEAMPRITE